jgi:hypothetical protein
MVVSEAGIHQKPDQDFDPVTKDFITKIIKIPQGRDSRVEDNGNHSRRQPARRNLGAVHHAAIARMDGNCQIRKPSRQEQTVHQVTNGMVFISPLAKSMANAKNTACPRCQGTKEASIKNSGNDSQCEERPDEVFPTQKLLSVISELMALFPHPLAAPRLSVSKEAEERIRMSRVKWLEKEKKKTSYRLTE